MKVLVILSGGLDSSTVLASLVNDGHEVGAVTFSYGSKHNAAENEAARHIGELYELAEHHFIDLEPAFRAFRSDLLLSGGDVPEGHYAEESMKKTVVPLRNGIMMTLAAGLAESLGFDAVAVGTHLGDHAIYPDCRTTFLQAMALAIKLGTWAGVEVLSPVQDLDKAGIVALAEELDLPFVLTHTCYNGERPGCGRCGACVERAEAFALNGLDDPLAKNGDAA